MADTLTTVSLLTLVPPNLQGDPQVIAAAEALDAELRLVTTAIDEALHLPRLDVLAEEVLDLLAWQWHVDFYEADLPLDQKRALIRKSVAWHRHKGTPWAVEQVVSAVFNDAKVTEWFDYNGQPYHFKVRTTAELEGMDTYKQLARAINSAKNVRSWLDIIQVEDVSAKPEIYIGFVPYFSGTHTIKAKE